MVDRLPGLESVRWLGIAGRTCGRCTGCGDSLVGQQSAAPIAYLMVRPRARCWSFCGRCWSPRAAAGRCAAPVLSLAAFDSLRSLELTVTDWRACSPIVVGIEVFATLEPAFAGQRSPAQPKGLRQPAHRRADQFGYAAALWPGRAGPGLTPAQPTSAMTQAMQQLLPAPLAWLGTVVAVVALLSVAAASAQAVQNLSLGLRSRRFAPAFLAQRNRHGVPDRPVKIVLALAVGCFLLPGARAETYLPLVVAGSLLLLMIVGWAAWRRARREAGTSSGAHSCCCCAVGCRVVRQRRGCCGVRRWLLAWGMGLFAGGAAALCSLSLYPAQDGQPQSVAGRAGTARRGHAWAGDACTCLLEAVLRSAPALARTGAGRRCHRPRRRRTLARAAGIGQSGGCGPGWISFRRAGSASRSRHQPPVRRRPDPDFRAALRGALRVLPKGRSAAIRLRPARPRSRPT